MIRPVKFAEDTLILLDQRRLPKVEQYNSYKDYREAIEAIKDMVVRGAPAIGITGAYALVLAALEFENNEDFRQRVKQASQEIIAARPTAVNLAWGVNRLMKIVDNQELSVQEVIDLLKREADNIRQEDSEICRQIGANGADLFDQPVSILTHCNAGALATSEYGTALGVVRALDEKDKLKDVFADETRPRLQGMQLTAYELAKDGITPTVITDNMAAVMMARGLVDAVVVGADRIAANGDTANKIGTYGLSILAKEHGIPFYIAAPLSTIDLACPRGEEITIEERDPKEVLMIGDQLISPDPEIIKVENPAFDVTPNKNITGIITEKGVVQKPYEENIKALFESTSS